VFREEQYSLSRSSRGVKRFKYDSSVACLFMNEFGPATSWECNTSKFRECRPITLVPERFFWHLFRFIGSCGDECELQAVVIHDFQIW
jgi:hypothetical protein